MCVGDRRLQRKSTLLGFKAQLLNPLGMIRLSYEQLFRKPTLQSHVTDLLFCLFVVFLDTHYYTHSHLYT